MRDSFCGQDEEHDPSEEYEEYLACSVCGDNGKSIFDFDVFFQCFRCALLLQNVSSLAVGNIGKKRGSKFRMHKHMQC